MSAVADVALVAALVAFGAIIVATSGIGVTTFVSSRRARRVLLCIATCGTVIVIATLLIGHLLGSR